jgi:transposase-like protein
MQMPYSSPGENFASHGYGRTRAIGRNSISYGILRTMSMGFAMDFDDMLQYGLSMANRDWDIAGFTDSQSRLGKPFDTGRVLVHRSIRIQERYLVWDSGKTHDDEPRDLKPSKGVLGDFVKLWQGDAEAILRYARKHGVLMLDEAGKPSSHWIPEGRDHLERWCLISRRACAVLNIAAALAQGKLGPAEDWNVIDSSLDASFPKSKNRSTPHGVSAARMYLQWELEAWAELGRITLSIRRDNRRNAWVTEIDFGDRLFAVLALQLLLTVADADGLYNCDGCKLPYARQLKRPKPGQSNFCPQCGRQAALRHADLRRKSRMRHARQLYGAGMSVVRIADRLKATPATVGRWVKLVRR